MARAAARGIWNPAGYDPEDRQQRRRLDWGMQILEQDLQIDMRQAVQAHWLGRLAVQQAGEQSTAWHLEQAGAKLQDYLVSLFPWLTDELASVVGGSVLGDPQQAYHAMMGRPGEARYEEMLRGMQQIRKLTDEEKQQDRERRWSKPAAP